MSVHVTRRRSGVWYAKGSVRAGNETVIVGEFSTGCRAKSDADAVAAAKDREVRQGLLHGGSAAVLISDCALSYVSRAGGVQPYDVVRVNEFNNMCGHLPLAEAPAAWQTWLIQRGAGQAPSSVARWRSSFQAMLNHGASANGLTAPRLPSVKGAAGIERVIYLSEHERRALLAAYNPAAMCPILVLAYQGMRTQEALQLDWRRVDLVRGTIHLPADETKSQRARTVPLHPKVDALLFGMWNAARRPLSGPVFLSSRGEPYTDTRGRDGTQQGGNPLTKAHETACRVAGVSGFRVHDWRHDWAARMVMAGVDLRTLMDLGGWSSLRMVQRYASVTGEHMADAIRRLA